MTSCEAWKVPDGDYIAKLELSYTSLGLQYIMMTTHKNSVKSRGVKLQNSQTYVSEYDQTNPLIGFAAYQTTSIMALGFYSYTCSIDTSKQWIGNTTSIEVITDPIIPVEEPKDPTTIINVVTVSGTKWWIGVLVTLAIIIPIIGLVVWWFRRKHVVAHRQSIIKMRDHSEDGEPGNVGGGPGPKGKDGDNLVLPFEQVPEHSNMSLGDDGKASQRPIQREDDLEFSNIKL